MHRKDSVVTARFCEGGHRCSPPKECCAQGCCYLFAPPSVPRSPPPATDHVLNLFFINHWYFWCVVLAIILALLCACSLWKKRRQLCGWGAPGGQRSHSEGDSAGSCYAPPQYSRCSSFHHAPPPYTEVTSKPDLYPLVFTCNGDSGGKSGASYLMVQYFRNYIVRPVGSLSGTSTVDSLSSSFICTANEANILVPPPYSRAASPEIPTNTNTHGYLIPRSASQQICNLDIINDFRPNSVPNCIINNNSQNQSISNNNDIRLSESANFSNLSSNTNNNINNNSNNSQAAKSVILSQSDQQFIRHNINNNNSKNNSGTINGDFITNNNNKQKNKTTHNDSTNAIYNSCGSIGSGSISISLPSNNRKKLTTSVTMEDERELEVLRKSLETCCQILQNHHMPSNSFSVESTINADVAKKYEGLRSFVNSSNGSVVSSLANNSPSSPPRATSPTDEVRELLDQINRLQSDSVETNTQYIPFEPRKNNNINNNNNNNNMACSLQTTTTTNKRPSSLQSKKKLFNKSNKGLYIPVSNANTKSLRSPLGSNSILCRGRGRRGWISRSAPTTPGTELPSRFEDDSPLLNEHDEDSEQNV